MFSLSKSGKNIFLIKVTSENRCIYTYFLLGSTSNVLFSSQDPVEDAVLVKLLISRRMGTEEKKTKAFSREKL